MSKYDDIINTPYPFKGIIHNLSKEERAAQFLPFDALTGYSEAIDVAQKNNNEVSFPDENKLFELNIKLQFLLSIIEKKPLVHITCFFKNSKYQNGFYDVFSGYIKKYDLDADYLVLNTGIKLKISNICDIEGECLNNF